MSVGFEAICVKCAIRVLAYHTKYCPPIHNAGPILYMTMLLGICTASPLSRAS